MRTIKILALLSVVFFISACTNPVDPPIDNGGNNGSGGNDGGGEVIPPSETFGTLTFATPSPTQLTVSFPGKNTGTVDYGYEIYVSANSDYSDYKYSYYDANADAYSHTFSSLNPNTQYFVKVVYVAGWTGTPIEQYTTTSKTAIQYGQPLAPVVTIKKSETTTTTVRLNFTAPTKDNSGNDITVQKYIITMMSPRIWTRNGSGIEWIESLPETGKGA